MSHERIDTPRWMMAWFASIIACCLAFQAVHGAGVDAPPKTPRLSVAGAPDLDRVHPLKVRAPRDKSLLVLHYHRPDGAYDDWNVWAWTDDQAGQAFAFTREDAFGRIAVIELDRDTERGNFIVRKGEWEHKDVDHDRSVNLSDDRIAEAWIVSGDPTVYTDPTQIDFGLKTRAAFLDEADRVRLSLSHPIESGRLPKDAISVMIDGQSAQVARVVPAASKGVRLSRVFDVYLRHPIAPSAVNRPMTVALPGSEPVALYPRDLLTDRAYTPLDAELGAWHGEQATTFRTWSPMSSSVELLLYETPDANKPTRTIPMSPEPGGLWEATVAGDLHGIYYQYRFTSHDRSQAVADIHGFAATPNSQRSMVVDLSRTDPPGFRDHQPPLMASATDEVIYEAHVRDFSVADPNVPVDHRGRYPGMTHTNGAGTSLSHLKELGVTAVHLMPIQDFGNERHGYNWGYWTSLFNVPESDYSTTPDDPAATIRELKQTIQTLHENGIRVILDVVYNHTSITPDPSPFEEAAPWHYFRTTDDGGMRNDAGTGNSIADERPMVRKYIVDSLLFWAEEYKVDGFRFDLVGTHRPQTVETIVRELRAVRPDLTLYGEPWTGGGPTYFGKGAQRGTTFAVFNDHLRNDVRGDLDGTGTGFVTGPGGNAPGVQRGVMGAINDFADAPTESVNYVSAHDNRTFWDKLEHTHPDLDDATKRRMQKLAHGIVLTSQGIAFIHGGADFARTKGGEHNSYNAGDGVNKFDWDRKREYRDVHDYITGLIALRKAHPAFRMSDAKQVRANLRFMDNAPAGVIAYQLNGAAVGDAWDRILVAYNGEPVAATLPLPAGAWGVVVNDRAAGNRVLGEARGRIELLPYSMWVAYQD